MSRASSLVLLSITIAASIAVASDPVLGPITVTASNPGDQFRPVIAYDAEHDRYLAVWHQEVSGVLQIVGRTVDADGWPLGNSFFITDEATDQTLADVVYLPDVDRYLVVWVNDYFGDGSDHDIRGRLVPWIGLDPSLTPFTINDAPTDQGHPRVAVSPSIHEVMIVWETQDVAAPPVIEAQRWSTSGSSVSPVLTIAADGGSAYLDPRVTWSEENDRYLIVYQRTQAGGDGDIYAAHLSYSGTVLAGDVGIAGFVGEEGQPDVAACEDGYLVVWAGNDGGGTKVFTRPVAADLALGTIVNLSDQFPGQGWPAVACRPASGGYLVAREALFIGDVAGVVGELVDPRGASVAEFNIRGAVVGSSREATRPAVATGDGRALVIWEEDRADLAHQDVSGRWVDLGLFVDGFERGDRSRWSLSQPQ